MSTYHITRFVLDHALRDALRSADAGDSAFWQAWLRGVVRMFRDRTLPPGLRAGLLREAKDTALAELVNNLPEVSREPVSDKTSAWIIRRDEGHARAARARQAENQRRLEEGKKQAAEAHQKYCEMMMPVWNAQLRAYVEQREAALQTVGIFQTAVMENVTRFEFC